MRVLGQTNLRQGGEAASLMMIMRNFVFIFNDNLPYYGIA